MLALSNYVMQLLIVKLLFCGYGLGLYGRVECYKTFYVILSVWIFQLVVSPFWLKYFQFGPLEWLWPSLTYWKPQPMLVRTAEPAAAAS